MILWLGLSGAMLSVSTTQVVEYFRLLGIWPPAFYYAAWALISLVLAARLFNRVCLLLSLGA